MDWWLTVDTGMLYSTHGVSYVSFSYSKQYNTHQINDLYVTVTKISGHWPVGFQIFHKVVLQHFQIMAGSLTTTLCEFNAQPDGERTVNTGEAIGNSRPAVTTFYSQWSVAQFCSTSHTHQCSLDL